MSSSLSHSAAPQKLSSNFENSTIQQQRQEIQLLTAELKDRDKELSDMVAVHRKQILAWERDRQKILTLAERCNLLNNELKKRNEIIKSLTQQKFKEMSQKVTDATVRCQALEEKNQSLHCSVFELSAKTGQLQAREQELLTMLKLKDEAILETTDHITEFTSKFRKLGSALHAAEVEKFNLNKKIQDLTVRLKELILERNKLKDDLCEKVKESNKQEEEIIQLRQENGYLRDELVLTVEKAKRVDQLLQFAKSKQARTNTELESLRQIYLKQQCDLQFLHVNLESSQELRQKHEKAAHEGSTDLTFSAPENNSETDLVSSEGSHEIYKECRTEQVPKSRVKTTSKMREADNRLLLDASDSEETTSEHLNQEVVKVLSALTEEEKQDIASSSYELDSKAFCEANNTMPLRNRETSENEVESRDQQTFESSLPGSEHCPNVSSYVELQSTLTQNTSTSDKTGSENKTWEEGTKILFYQKSRETPPAIHKSESDSSSDNFNMKKDARWKPVSDMEWLESFKPINGDGSTWHGKDCSCLKTGQQMKHVSSESGDNVDLGSFHSDSVCFTSTQKRDRSQTCEKFSDEDFPLEIEHLSVTKPASRCCRTTVDQDTSSPMNKLQRALAEYRQMVADLELSTLLQATPHCSPHSSNPNRTPELPEALHRTQLSAAEERDTFSCL
ncbi:coiled-coil domain-containing protein 62 [Indicator indicator]|uniref:coiled-coil domain-containing protein 62 n=1 Tax=Indicator indicator TaxID=1002788 RepID=UPI0023DF5C23|nr:coiled-coil domain-containing protein 62 [Indicator indicator]